MEWQMLIDGREANAASRFERRSPANGEIVGSYPEAELADVERAIAAARKAFDDGRWSNLSAQKRSAVLRKTAELIRAHQDALAKNLCAEVGKPIKRAAGEVLSAAEAFDYYAALALDLRGEALSQQVPDALGLILKEPVGVVGMITPWNFPLVLAGWKLAPALAAGCTCVIKPSHLTPGSTLLLGKLLLEAGLPAGVVNVVTGARDNGGLVGQALCKSPLVDKVAFTGSTATGRKVAETAAQGLKRVSLELGGKSPNIVFADVSSLDAAVMGAFHGIYFNSGQVCQAGSRLLVQESIKDAFLEKLVAATRSMKVGDPADPKTVMGPLVSEPQFEKVMSFLDEGKKSAQLLAGGGRLGDKGFFVEPTIFDRVDNRSRVAQEEIFGPVLSVISFKDRDEALRIANDTLYGLAAAVWTQNLDTALGFAKSLKAGTVWVNSFHSAGLWGMPFGGYKQSGLGRELGHAGLESFLETKSVHIKLS